jgi:hypothetical protein
MTISLYINCLAIAILGLIISMLMQMKSLSDKAKSANVIFIPKTYFQKEWISILIAIAIISLWLILLPAIAGLEPKYEKYFKIFSLPMGYMGTDIVLKFLGLINKKINSAIGYKSNIADKETGTTNEPTPAEPVKPIQ